ncbi:hypothetical protein LEP1GSC050_4011 [Leptospira broomii serovar Hurstbridge str. 5399]|uniref:Uncharacterized protein n=1 Tax=Leptospira broomii serovar Hurstbridge str. 5399 TaxID=1049789 RepID=T0F917_9LEPT|nr:hypothetical protein LEP1GSC050_4011 [Leptospira broomii serovar Hurstbridge str. 5399]
MRCFAWTFCADMAISDLILILRQIDYLVLKRSKKESSTIVKSLVVL